MLPRGDNILLPCFRTVDKPSDPTYIHTYDMCHVLHILCRCPTRVMVDHDLIYRLLLPTI